MFFLACAHDHRILLTTPEAVFLVYEWALSNLDS